MEVEYRELVIEFGDSGCVVPPTFLPHALTLPPENVPLAV